MQRIIMHWSAGGHTPSNLDKEHYHFIIAGDGTVVPGKWPVEANRKPVKGKYAAHTLNCNSGSIGVAVAAMAGAVERPFDAGSAPITPAQVKALATLCRDLAAKYKIPVTRETILSHAEVQPTLKIKQRGKWDIAWLPGMKGPGDPVAVGDKIRALISGTTAKPAPKAATGGVMDQLASLGFADVKSFQGAYGLEVDGIVGPKTRAAMHGALSAMKIGKTSIDEPSMKHRPTIDKPAQRESAAPVSKAKETAATAAGGAAGAGVVLALVAFGQDIAQGWRDFWLYVFSFIN